MSSTEELVGLVLAALHPRLRERCTESKILAVLEELYIMMRLNFFAPAAHSQFEFLRCLTASQPVSMTS